MPYINGVFKQPVGLGIMCAFTERGVVICAHKCDIVNGKKRNIKKKKLSLKYFFSNMCDNKCNKLFCDKT